MLAKISALEIVKAAGTVSKGRYPLGYRAERRHSWPPVQAGTCVPVTVKGRAADPATATTKASIKLTQRAASLRGRIKNSSTNCQKGPPGGFVCTTSAVVCP